MRTQRLDCIREKHVIWVPIDVNASWTNTWLARVAPYTIGLDVWVVVGIGYRGCIQFVQVNEVERRRWSRRLVMGRVVPILVAVVGE